MHSRSSCDCYCKTRVPIAQQRKEIHSARNRVVSSSRSSAKTVVMKKPKKVAPISARLVDDEELESRSTITLPVSPMLSPETTAALEDSERLIKDTEIQLKRISMPENVGPVQNYTSTWPDRTSLDDENDQLLYIRERVAYKFQEANGWVDTSRVPYKNQELFNRNVQSRKTVDFSDPKFRSSEERYLQYLRQRNLGARKPGFSVPVDFVGARRETKNSNETFPVNWESMRNGKLAACSVQTVPSVDIKAELISQRLKSVHISPDASFERQTSNVRTYEIKHDRKTCSVRKEKLTRIPTETETSIVEVKRTDTKDFDDNSSTSVSKEKSEEPVAKCASEENEKHNLRIQTETNVESNSSNDHVDRKNDESKDEKSQSIPNISNGEQITEFKNEQKQVRFNEDVLEESLESKFDFPLVSKDEVTRCAPLSSEEIETRRLINKRRHEEICGKRKREKEERYKVVDQRFTDVLKRYCDDEVKPSRSSMQNSSEDSDQSDLGLYEPCLNRFDDLLTTYNKLINNVARSTKTIDEFLSRAEYTDKFSKNETEMIKTRCPRPQRRKDSISKHRLSSMNKNINRERQRRTTKSSSIKSLIFVGDNDPRKSYVVSKQSNKFPRRSNEPLGLVKNEESTDADKIIVSNDVEQSRPVKKLATDKLSLFGVKNDSSSLISSSSSSRSVNERKIFQDRTSNFRGQKEKNGLDHAVLYDVVCSNVMKEILPKTNNVEHSIAKVLGEETRLIEQKVESFFNAEKIVPLLTKGLLENLRSNFVNFEPGFLENPPRNDTNVANVQSSGNEEMNDSRNKDSATEKCDSKSLRNSCNAKSREISSINKRSPIEEIDKTDSGSTKQTSNTKYREIKSKNGDCSIGKSYETDSKSWRGTSDKKSHEIQSKNGDCSIEKSYETDSKSSRGTSDKKSHEIISKSENSYKISSNGKNSSTEEIHGIDSKFSNVKSREIDSNINFPNVPPLDSKENNDLNSAQNCVKEEPLQNLDEEENLCVDVSKDFDKAARVVENATQNDSTILTGNAISEVPDENCARTIQSVEKDQISSSESLHDCVSIRSSKNISKTSSNVVESPRKISETKTVLEINNENNNEESNGSNSRFDRAFERDKILSELYDSVHKQLYPSMFYGNNSTVFDQNWRSNSISAVKSKFTTSSSSSHSEGELHVPSSGSYSIGEVRILTKNRSDEENTDDDITVLLTEQTLTSWNEFSKALVQSMGEI